MSRAVYCGNFEYEARQSEIERLFDRYGRISRVDMKTGSWEQRTGHASGHCLYPATEDRDDQSLSSFTRSTSTSVLYRVSRLFTWMTSATVMMPFGL
ncbi:unnamed protein product [Closterium sp. Naga37s-1]|nr:unnamed protein product [Closterium sp. Naga37s-1]